MHFSANFWRFKEIDFKEASVKGTLAGTGFADWPITYQDLEPYYTKVDWEVGVAGAPGPYDPPRSRRTQCRRIRQSPPACCSTRREKARLQGIPRPDGDRVQTVQRTVAVRAMRILLGFGCEVRAKSGSLVTVIPKAVATGRCEIRPNSYARKIETDSRGRATGVKYFDANKKEVFQRAKAVVVCANGAETPRLLLNSKSNLFPNGLANSSGVVGKHLMLNGAGLAAGVFDHEVNGYKGIVATRVVWDLYELDHKLGLVGGGGSTTGSTSRRSSSR